MFKRIRWIGMGAAIGISFYKWLKEQDSTGSDGGITTSDAARKMSGALRNLAGVVSEAAKGLDNGSSGSASTISDPLGSTPPTPPPPPQ